MLIALLAVAIGATILSGLMTIYFDVPRQMGAQFRNYGANMIFAATDSAYTRQTMDKGLEYIDEVTLTRALEGRTEL